MLADEYPRPAAYETGRDPSAGGLVLVHTGRDPSAGGLVLVHTGRDPSAGADSY